MNALLQCSESSLERKNRLIHGGNRFNIFAQKVAIVRTFAEGQWQGCQQSCLWHGTHFQVLSHTHTPPKPISCQIIKKDPNHGESHRWSKLRLLYGWQYIREPYYRIRETDPHPCTTKFRGLYVMIFNIDFGIEFGCKFSLLIMFHCESGFWRQLVNV